MLSPKAYLKFAIGALVLPSYLGFESATASVQDKVNVLSSLELAPVVQKQTNLKLGSSLQIAEYEEADTDKLKGSCCCSRPRNVNYYRTYNRGGYGRGHGRGHGYRRGYGHEDYEEHDYGHGRGRGHRDRYREHETVHFGRHQKRHGRRCH
jgi:hypothetical protein